MQDLGEWKYGKPLIFCPGGYDVVVYRQPDGPGTDWLRP